MFKVRKIRSILALALFVVAPGMALGQITPEMIQKARQAGATDAQIQAALSGNASASQTNVQNRRMIVDTTSGRKELDSAMLQQVNPNVFQNRDSLTGRQIEYEIVWEDNKFVRRPIPVVFGQEMFQNKNLTFAPNYNMATPPSYVLGAGDEVGDRQFGADSGGGRLLADRQVGRAAVFVVADDFVGAGAALEDHLFEFADHQHRFIQFGRFGLGDLLRLVLSGERAVVGVRRDRFELERRLAEVRAEVAEVVVCHFLFSLSRRFYE